VNCAPALDQARDGMGRFQRRMMPSVRARVRAASSAAISETAGVLGAALVGEPRRAPGPMAGIVEPAEMECVAAIWPPLFWQDVRVSALQHAGTRASVPCAAARRAACSPEVHLAAAAGFDAPPFLLRYRAETQ